MKIRHELLLFLLTIVFLLPLISNPGFFSHDELQKIDYIYRSGFWEYIKDLGVFHVGTQFASPIRPLAFIIQGIQGIFMYDAPFLSHFIDILLHASCAIMLFRVVAYVTKNKNFAFLSSVIFILSPLALFSVGWTAALMDRLYTLFSLIVAYYSLRYLNEGELKRKNLIIISIATFLAIASKETSIIMPALVFLIVFWKEYENKRNIFCKKNLLLFFATATPVFFYIMYRFPSIVSSFSGQAGGVYTPSFANVLPNIFAYWAFPFLPFTVEASNMLILTNKFLISFAVACHILLVLFLFKKYGIKKGIFYLALYFLPLAPILMLPYQASIYLYASATVFSVLVASLFLEAYCKKNKWLLVFSIIIIIISLVHVYYMQKYLYSYGICMNKALTSLESEYLHAGKPESIVIHSDKNAPKYIMDRVVFQRVNIGKYFPILLKSTDIQFDKKTAKDEGGANFRFSSDCIVY